MGVFYDIAFAFAPIVLFKLKFLSFAMSYKISLLCFATYI